MQDYSHIKTRAYIPCTTGLESKKTKTVVSHDFENLPQPPKNEFAKGCTKSNSILKLKHFFKALCPM